MAKSVIFRRSGHRWARTIFGGGKFPVLTGRGLLPVYSKPDRLLVPFSLYFLQILMINGVPHQEPPPRSRKVLFYKNLRFLILGSNAADSRSEKTATQPVGDLQKDDSRIYWGMILVSRRFLNPLSTQ